MNSLRSISKIFFIYLYFSSLCFGKVTFQTRELLNTADLQHLHYETSLAGGAGGVDVYTFNGKKYTLKGSQETDHINEEIMTDGLYNSLGVPVPPFIVLDSLDGLENLNSSQHKWPKGPYRIAEFIEGYPPTKEDIGKVKDFFVVDAFLANRDVAPGTSQHMGRNIIVKEGVIYRIDNGGGLRVRSIGGRKGENGDSWDSSLIPELKTLLTHGSMAYEGLSDKEAQTQMLAIIQKAPRLLRTFQSISSALNLSEPHHIELEHMLIGRLRTLTVLAHPHNTYNAARHRYTSPFTAAGAFILAWHEDKLKVLIGQRKSSQPHIHGTWCTLGGQADYGIDLDLATAASREIYEESGKRINIPDTEMRVAPSHDLVRPDHLFRQYIVLTPYVDLSDINYGEYQGYNWIPLKQLLSKKTLDTGKIESTEMKLFAPFWDLLKTQRVPFLLNQYATLTRPQIKSEKLPLRQVRTQLKLTRRPVQESHTQSTLQSLDLPPQRKIERFPEELYSTQFEKERQFGRSVLSKSIVQKDIRMSRPKKGLSAANYSSNDDATSPRRYTASEGHLRIYLGEGSYAPVTTESPLEPLNTNVRRALEKMNIKEPDRFFVDQLTQALLKERSYNPGFMVLYHGCDGSMGFLFDIFTELRQLVRGQFHKHTRVFRGIDEAFNGVDNILSFQRKFGIDPKDKIKTNFDDNYSRNYPDAALSTNIYLFGNPEIDASSSIRYFFENLSARPIDITSFLSYLEQAFGGLKLNKDRYTRLYESIIGQSIKENGRLYQIFIHPSYINTLVYGSLVSGKPYYFDYKRLRKLLDNKDLSAQFPDIVTSVTHSCTPNKAPLKIVLTTTTTAPKAFIEVLKQTPPLFEEAINTGHSSRAPGVNALQARLLLHPQCLHNPNIVQTFMYHRTEAAQNKHEQFVRKLREYLKEDLTVWLQKKEMLESGVVLDSDTPSAARAQYAALYEQSLGNKYIPREVGLNKVLERVKTSQNPTLLEQIIKKHGLQVLVIPIVSADSYRNTIPADQTSLLYQDWVLEYIEDYIDNPSEPQSEKEKLKQFVRASLPEKKLLDLLRIHLYQSHDTRRLDKYIKRYGFKEICLTEFYGPTWKKELIDEEWVYKYFEGLINNPSPETLPAREQLTQHLLSPILKTVAQLKDWNHFKDIEIPYYLYLFQFRMSAREVFVSLLEKVIFDRPLSPQEVLDILKGVALTKSDARRFFELDFSYPPGKSFVGRMIQYILNMNKENLSLEEKKEFLKEAQDLISSPELIYNSILESSLPDAQKKECELWKDLYEKAEKKQDFVTGVYGLYFHVENPFDRYKLIKESASFWGPYANQVTTYAVESCVRVFSYTKYYPRSGQKQDTNKISLTVEEISQFTRFLEALLPLIGKYDSKLRMYKELYSSLTNMRNFFIPNTFEKFKNDPSQLAALQRIIELLDFIKR